MRGAFVLYFYFLIFCSGLPANAEKISGTQTISTASQVRYHGYSDAPGITIEIISNQAVTITPFNPAGTLHFSEYFLPPVIITGTGVLIRRLLPDLHAIIKSIIFPHHFFW